MEGLTDSDLAMAATDSFNKILYNIQNSCLNYQLKLTPFTAIVSLKKTFAKNRSGKPIIPDDTKNRAFLDSDRKASRMQPDFYLMQCKHQELMQNLSDAYATIEVLKKLNSERENEISDLKIKLKSAEEATAFIDKTHNDTRVRFEMDKIELFNKHEDEIESLREELGEMARKHMNLEDKFLASQALDKPLDNFEMNDDHTQENLIPTTTMDSPLVQNTTQQVSCSSCSTSLENYTPNYILGEIVKPMCKTCQVENSLLDSDVIISPEAC